MAEGSLESNDSDDLATHQRMNPPRAFENARIQGLGKEAAGGLLYRPREVDNVSRPCSCFTVLLRANQIPKPQVSNCPTRITQWRFCCYNRHPNAVSSSILYKPLPASGNAFKPSSRKRQAMHHAESANQFLGQPQAH